MKAERNASGCVFAICIKANGRNTKPVLFSVRQNTVTYKIAIVAITEIIRFNICLSDRLAYIAHMMTEIIIINNIYINGRA